MAILLNRGLLELGPSAKKRLSKPFREGASLSRWKSYGKKKDVEWVKKRDFLAN
jgi:hypothetical protein